MARYKTGPLERVEGNSEFTYLGLPTGRDSQGSLYLRQNDYVGSLEPILVEYVVRNNKFRIDQEKWRTVTRQMVGGLLRRGRTFFEVCAVATHISTTDARSLNDASVALSLIKLINKPLRMLKEDKAPIF